MSTARSPLTPRPLISIITATYNRSNVLQYSIASVLRQTMTDWELIVVGDACTDDTAQVVESLGDPRVRFFNLPHNIGEQSGPNNAGFQAARGELIAYLNHDDLWFPDHLEHCLDELQQCPADLVFSLSIAVTAEGRRVLLGATESGWYGPQVVAPASSWLLRREVIEEIGGWRSCRKLYGAPSQDVLFRAWKAGKRLRATHHVSLLAIQSGDRKGCYANRDEREHKIAFERLVSAAGFRESELTLAAISLFDRSDKLQVWPLLRRVARNVAFSICSRCGVSSHELAALLRHRSRGRFINQLRQTRGLAQLQREHR